MKEKTIIIKRDGAIKTISLNRPEFANALNLGLAKEFYEAICDCACDKSLRALILTGKGKFFCAGGDLKFLLGEKDRIKNNLLKMTNYLHGAIAMMVQMNAPVVVAVNGTAGGGGLSLAISGDIVISASSAKFTLAYTKAGLSPDASSTFYLPRLIGMRRAKELMLSNRLLTAQEAYDIGMIDKVVEDNKLMEVSKKLAEEFASGPTLAYGAVKKLLNKSFSNDLETQMKMEGDLISDNGSSPDGIEGMLAFSEKRNPKYSGSL